MSSSQAPSNSSYGAGFFLVPPFAASVSLIPTFYGFIAKSSLQLGESIPRISLRKVVQHPGMLPRMALKELLATSFIASPFIGGLIGAQIITLRLLEKKFSVCKDGQARPPSYWSMLFNATVVGVVSIPAVAILNGLSVRHSPVQSLKELTVKQAGSIVLRDASFLLALRVRAPLTEQMTQIYGQGKTVEYGVPFISGVIGSLVGHPADTALTLWQKNKQVTSVTQLMRGATVRAISIGCFSVIYSVVVKRLLT